MVIVERWFCRGSGMSISGERVCEGDRLLDVELLERRWNVEVWERVIEVAVDALRHVAEVDGGAGSSSMWTVFARTSSDFISARRKCLL